MIDYYAYLKEIGINDGVVRDRIDEIIEYYNNFYSSELLKDIFVCDYISEDGNRNYTSLWLIYDTRVCEAKNFITETDIDATFYLKQNFIYWNLKGTSLISADIKDSDRMNLQIEFNQAIKGTFKASKNNCSYLLKILKNYFI